MISRLPSYIRISFLLLLILGYFGIMTGIDAYAFTDCDQQSSSQVDCPPLSSQGSENDNNDDDSGNIEEQIPSVLPFP
jgi:hypothetical protein